MLLTLVLLANAVVPGSGNDEDGPDESGTYSYMLGSRREFSSFVNQLDEMAYRLTSYIDQSIYELTSLYMNTSF